MNGLGEPCVLVAIRGPAGAAIFVAGQHLSGPDRTAGKILGTTMSTGSGRRCTTISVAVLLA
jgi:hypothetical protein